MDSRVKVGFMLAIILLFEKRPLELLYPPPIITDCEALEETNELHYSFFIGHIKYDFPNNTSAFEKFKSLFNIFRIELKLVSNNR